MAQPVWVTPAGSLGTIPEGVFFQLPLLAYDPDEGEIYYEVIAGALPAGMQCARTGLIVGVPKAIVSLQGVPYEVARDVTSKFAVRAYTEKVVNGREVVDRIADRTYSLTVTGEDPPVFITPAGLIATYFDGIAVTDLQIEYTDTDPGDIVTITVAAGALPTGLTISSNGLISGFIQPLAQPGGEAGFDRTGSTYDQYPFDFSTRSSSFTYEFTLKLTDGKTSDLRTFSIQVNSTNSLTADSTEYTADSTVLTADVSPVRAPILLTPTGSIGVVRNDNFFAFQFTGLDLDGDPFTYSLGFDSGDSTGLPGLTLDPETGWLYGYIPNLGLTDNTYPFYVEVYKTNSPSIISAPYYFSLEVIGAINTDITWLVPDDLGTIDVGSISVKYVLASTIANLPILYRLKSGSDSTLPQGLELLPSGELAGRVSFNTFALDLGTTTFDVTFNDLAVDNIDTTTTFDLEHTFTVNAYSPNLFINVFKTFTITVNRAYNAPYENLYITAMPSETDREVISSLLQNQDIIVPGLLYRQADPNFGRANSVMYDHAFGLTAATYAEYVSSLDFNHYRKTLTLGEIETAQALDTDGTVLYEVVFSRIIENLVNNDGTSVSKEVVLPYPINGGDSTEVALVYPNSLENMREQVIDTVGKIGNILPLWMTSKQKNGKVLGFVPAWIIAYTKPSKSGQIAYNIASEFGTVLNTIDFEVDRYELDRLLSVHWNTETDSWTPEAAETTFDLELHYQLPVPNDSSFAFVGGLGYAVNDEILILGSQIGGTDAENDVIIRITSVDELGTILTATADGIAPLFSLGDTYFNIVGTNITGTGTGATWDLEVVSGTATIIDGNSIRFIAPVDGYDSTTDYDKYLVFPKENILA